MRVELDKSSTSKEIYHLLRKEIISWNLVPGLNISEKEISEKFNVSRTPVREAFVRLSNEGLLNIYPQKGTFVSLIDLSAIDEGRFMREHMERAVIKLACKSFCDEKIIQLEMSLKFQKMYNENHDYKNLFEEDDKFHTLIFEGCKKKRIFTSINEMNSDFQRVRELNLIDDLKWEDIYSQHVGILDAIKSRQPVLAEKIVKEHLGNFVLNKDELKCKYPGYFKE